MKRDFVADIAKETGASQAEVRRILSRFVEKVSHSLKKGENVRISGFGTFSVAKRKARTGRNPQTGEEIKIPAKKAVRFKAGYFLKNAMKK